ncbi:ComF family protein [Terrilactibacillus sp. BCM23-1]|uniref:ComF family protein n=1 Tax=Terrilactibacillus tamarindi TaxID=2599694 RepID=A0A6N8CN61_9BACI|nr:phosphoribosyltransferase family protein [Terrilactibacillus tamarindi]MTT31554.1 ComF family protein [Terrilactibacillus tamarindi]
MSLCIWCQSIYAHPLDFRHLLSVSNQVGYCPQCVAKLEQIPAHQSCRLCGRDLTKLDAIYIKDGTCLDCMKWEEGPLHGLLEKNYALYSYNDFMKEIMSTFKFRGDVLLAVGFKPLVLWLYKRVIKESPLTWFEKARYLFLYQMGWQFKEYPYVIVPLPLSQERLKERGYNQSVVLAELLQQPVIPALQRREDGGKQSKKGRAERLNTFQNPYRLDSDYTDAIRDKYILLIDDIYTTGTTLRLAAAALKVAKPKQVISLTLCHG